MSLVDKICEEKNNTNKSVMSINAGRGRGKSAAMGIAVSSSVVFSYSNIFVTAPDPNNLLTFFEFAIVGLKALNYKEHKDFEVLKGTDDEYRDKVIRINIFRDHKQTISYIAPNDSAILKHCDLLLIDEAAAIPLNIVKNLMGSTSSLTIMSSTIQGYEGTGRSLSLKLLKQLQRRQKPHRSPTQPSYQVRR